MFSRERIVNRSSRSIEQSAVNTHTRHLRVKSATSVGWTRRTISSCHRSLRNRPRALRYLSALLNVMIYHACIARLLWPTGRIGERSPLSASSHSLIFAILSQGEKLYGPRVERKRKITIAQYVKRVWTMNALRVFNRAFVTLRYELRSS